MSTIYRELKQIIREARLLDRRRVIREAVELAICCAMFIVAVILMFSID